MSVAAPIKWTFAAMKRLEYNFRFFVRSNRQGKEGTLIARQLSRQQTPISEFVYQPTSCLRLKLTKGKSRTVIAGYYDKYPVQPKHEVLSIRNHEGDANIEESFFIFVL